MVSFQAKTTVSKTLPACVYLIASDTDPVIQTIESHHPAIESVTADARFSTDFLAVSIHRIGLHYLVLVGLDNRTDAASIGHGIAAGCQAVQSGKLHLGLVPVCRQVAPAVVVSDDEENIRSFRSADRSRNQERGSG